MSLGRLPPGKVILCADDYAISAGVSRAVRELADAGRLSATSAIVTLPRAAEEAGLLAASWPDLAVGLHLNLTLGAPLGAMPGLAPAGTLPAVGRLVRDAFTARLDRDEIAAEIHRQLTAFITCFGRPPDHVDGHQHVHVLPGVRTALLDTLKAMPELGRPLLRDPSDRMLRIVFRGLEPGKALVVSQLARGFATLANRNGFPTNKGFSGFSGFDVAHDYADELARALRSPGPAQMVMCHPGHPDEELAALDPVVERRGQELAVLLADRRVGEVVARIVRDADGRATGWR